MRTFLKEQSFALPDGESLTIRELSAGGRRALIECTKAHKGDPFMIGAVCVRAGCAEFAEMTAEQVLDLFPVDLLNDLATAIMRLSGLAQDSEAQAEKN